MTRRAILPALAIFVAQAMPALAHSGHGDGFSAGLLHPMTGLDHVLAMVAVGVWGVALGARAIMVLPVVFVAAMIAGASAVLTGGPAFPAGELMIIASLIVLGGVIAARAAPGLPVASGITALFAFAHGQAHGMEITAGIDAGLYIGGFAAATMLMHMSGAATALLLRRHTWLHRAFGALTAAAGVALLAG